MIGRDGEEEFRVGSCCFSLGSCSLSGPRGLVHLTAQPARLAERLFRVPGVTVGFEALLDAMYGRDREPAPTADAVLRQRIKTVRDAVQLVGIGDVRIRVERGLGYVLELVRR